jgi:hypothetical protein
MLKKIDLVLVLSCILMVNWGCKQEAEVQRTPPAPVVDDLESAAVTPDSAVAVAPTPEQVPDPGEGPRAQRAKGTAVASTPVVPIQESPVIGESVIFMALDQFQAVAEKHYRLMLGPAIASMAAKMGVSEDEALANMATELGVAREEIYATLAKKTIHESEGTFDITQEEAAALVKGQFNDQANKLKINKIIGVFN